MIEDFNLYFLVDLKEQYIFFEMNLIRSAFCPCLHFRQA